MMKRAKEGFMRLWKQRAVLVTAAGAVLALAATLTVGGDLAGGVLTTIMGATLIGMYVLRRYARAELLYARVQVQRSRTGRDTSPRACWRA
jgi:hypothetical protein